ncbi:MAG: S8 family serine peptidase, partial [Pseudomonadales bacterium]|nr:S8 family serine peptidase [Pseudomonadales bacterium]
MSHRSRRRRTVPHAAFISLLTLLGACGGGGGGGSAPAATTPAANQPPVAVFSLSAGSGFAPLSVQFDASSSRDPDGTITGYSWDFGDGSIPASGVSTTHLFADPGTYSVGLTVTDNEGRTATAFSTVRARGARLTGTLSILPISAVDSDVNDRLTTPIANNSFATAQALPNPVRLGGYLNLPGRGSSTGGLFSSGDSSDFYAVSLTGNELIVLTAGDAAADLDLRLWDSAHDLVDASLGSGASESLGVPGPGAYFVEVLAFDGPTNIAGASNYVLGIGQDLSAAASGLLRTTQRLSDRFVPGEILLEPARNDMQLHTDNTGQSRLQARHRLEPAERSGRTLRTRLRSDSHSELQTGLPAGLSGERLEKYATLLSLKRLSADPEVAHAEANALAHPLLTPNDPFYNLQWHYPVISLPGAWDLSTGGAAEPVIVAVLDTGILPQHPDLTNQLVAGYDFISSPGRARDGNGIDADPTDEGDLAYGASSSFHGSHVAGTVAADSDNAIGVAGVSWQARIMPLRVLGVDGGTSFDISQAIRFAAGLSNSSGTLP